MSKKLGIVLVLIAFSGTVSAASIGISPGYQHFGTLEKGETATVDLYITTQGYNEPFEVRPEYGNPITGNLFNDMGPVRPDEVSEQDISSWMRFEEGSFEIDPTTTETYEVADVTVNAEGVVKATIVVPNDAEPGYHAGTIDLNPQVGADGTGFGTSARGQSVFQFSFRVPGNANRNIEVTDVEVLRTGGNEATLRTSVENYGSVTTGVRGGELKILSMEGEELEKVSASGTTLAPGESGIVESTWRGVPDGGQYQVSGQLNYLTGQATLGQVFNLPQQIEVVEPEDNTSESPSGEGGEKDGLPLWLVVMALVVFGVLMYSFGIDPVWIFGIVGFLGIAFFILSSSISNIFLVGLLISAGILTYYSMV